MGSNLVEELLKGGEDIVVLDNMHIASCNDLPGINHDTKKIYHLGISSTLPIYKKNTYLVGEALGFNKENTVRDIIGDQLDYYIAEKKHRRFY